MKQNICIILKQTQLEECYRLPIPCTEVSGMVLEYIHIEGVVNPDMFISISCPEIRISNRSWNMSFLLDHYEDLLWIQEWPITSHFNLLQQNTHSFPPTDIQSIHFNLKPTTITFNPGGYILWKLKLYF